MLGFNRKIIAASFVTVALFVVLYGMLPRIAVPAATSQAVSVATQARPVISDPDSLHRYELRPANKTAIPQRPITRQTYIDYIKRQPPHGSTTGLYSETFLKNPKVEQYGPRYAFPALALFVATGDRRFGEGIKVSLQDFYRVLKEKVAQDGWNAWFEYEPALIEMHIRYLKKGGIITEENEQGWVKEMILLLNRTVHVLGTPETFWRGPHHRAQGEGVMKRLAILRYPDAPEAKTWEQYAETVWKDWWDYRDSAINDTGYFFGQLSRVVLGAALMERNEVFTDPQMKRFWERLLYQVTSDGALMPYGAHGGWNSGASDLLWIMELVAARTRDGRYRWAAHKLMNYLEYQEKYLHHNHLLTHFTKVGAALAYFFADDGITPVAPDSGSHVLFRKETLRVRGKEGAARYYKDLDATKDRARIDSDLIMTQRNMPDKIVFKSGINAGDLTMLVELFPRHEPLNPSGILGLMQHGAALAVAQTSKDTTTLENMLGIEDLSGKVKMVTNPNPDTVDAFNMDVTVDPFADHLLATHAIVHVKDYLGFPMTHYREFFFIKNRFVVVRDTCEFRASFHARLGPVWHTQNIGRQIGESWANTYFHGPISQQVPMRNPAWDLLVFHAPQPGRKLLAGDRGGWVPYTLRYIWEGPVGPERRVHFTQVLLPHGPTPNVHLLAEGIKVLRNTLDQIVIRVDGEDKRQEWIVLNSGGETLTMDGLTTDARQLYLDVKDGKAVRTLATAATYVALNGRNVVRQVQRRTVERP
jgi:hypothetical protein